MRGASLGGSALISLGARIDTHAGQIEIGDDVHIPYRVHILAHDGAVKHTRTAPGKSPVGRVVIERDVFIGVNSVALKGVTVGEHRVIGAGSIVTKSVSPYSLVCGNPARMVRTLSQAVPEHPLSAEESKADARDETHP